jgi:hypothetical protein
MDCFSSSIFLHPAITKLLFQFGHPFASFHFLISFIVSLFAEVVSHAASRFRKFFNRANPESSVKCPTSGSFLPQFEEITRFLLEAFPASLP